MTIMVHDFDSGQAERRAIRQLIADLPNPQSFARVLPGPVAPALVSSIYDRRAPGYRCRTAEDAQLLRRWGLCEFPPSGQPGLMLTNFGEHVRRFALEGERSR